MIVAGLIAIAVGLTIWRLMSLRADLIRRGQVEERLRQIAEDVARQKRQGEIMAEHRTVEDAEDRLDDGSF